MSKCFHYHSSYTYTYTHIFSLSSIEIHTNTSTSIRHLNYVHMSVTGAQISRGPKDVSFYIVVLRIRICCIMNYARISRKCPTAKNFIWKCKHILSSLNDWYTPYRILSYPSIPTNARERERERLERGEDKVHLNTFEWIDPIITNSEIEVRTGIDQPTHRPPTTPTSIHIIVTWWCH